MEKKIGGCVILFNPETDVVANIQTYCCELDVLYVIDNSPVQDTLLLEKIGVLSDKIVFRWMGGNQGIGAALNVACRLAVEAHCDWLLTMDQDSSFVGNDLEKLVAGQETINSSLAPIGILSPVHLVSADFISSAAQRYTEPRFVMTSGNLLNLSAVPAVGPFEEKLFIDCVDLDYCLRLRRAGYHIVQDNAIHLRHSLGDFETGRLAALRIGFSNHNPVRRYYITRNKLYLLQKYWRFDPVLSWLVLRSMLGDTVRILFFEKQKGRKFRAILVGLWHSLTGHYGVLRPGKHRKGGMVI